MYHCLTLFKDPADTLFLYDVLFLVINHPSILYTSILMITHGPEILIFTSASRLFFMHMRLKIKQLPPFYLRYKGWVWMFGVMGLKKAHWRPEDDVYSLWWGLGWSDGRRSGIPGRGSVWRCNKGTRTHRHTQRTLQRRRSRPAGRSRWLHCRYMSVRHTGTSAACREAEEGEREEELSAGALMICWCLRMLCDFRENESSPESLFYPKNARGENMKGLSETCTIF